MSIRLMTMMWDIQFPTQSQLLIALKLADFASDDGGSIFPSKNTIATKAQTSESTVKTVLRAFRSIGLLVVVAEGGTGPRATTHYNLNVRLMKALVDGKCGLVGSSESLEIEWEPGVENEGAEFAPLDELRGQPSPLRGQPADAKGAAGYPQSINNHQLDSSGARAGECDVSATPARLEKAEASLTITSGDVSWEDWLKALDPPEREATAARGWLTATARWPQRGRAIDVAKPDVVSLSARIVGSE